MMRTIPARSCLFNTTWSGGPIAKNAPLRSCGRGRRQLLFASTRHNQIPPLLSEAATKTQTLASSVIASSPSPVKEKTLNPPLSLLSLGSILRSLVITSIFSSRLLLPPSLKVMTYLAHSPSRLLSPDYNFLMHWILKRTFYAQFCAGEDGVEVRRTIGRLKEMGYSGIILVYARELGLDNGAATQLKSEFKENERSLKDVQLWKAGTLETVRLASDGDFVSVKFTGAGLAALYHLSHNLPPPPSLETAIAEICDLAVARNIRLLIDAEQQAIQAGIDSWTLDFMRRYNRRTPEEAVVYGTYQTYLKSTPQTLATHLATAYKEGFTLGVKLVRGAYLASDPRHLIHDTKQETDQAFDSITESLIKRSYSGIQPSTNPTATAFPPITLVLATHNRASVRKAQALITALRGGNPSNRAPGVVYAQLMGMADEVSCELLQAAASRNNTTGPERVPRTHKYLAWGTVGECMKYLLRRAEENRDAVQRTREGRNELIKEVWRRVRGFAGLKGN